jgi:DNA-binding LacI/PurR family transcriptional regulator
VPYYVSFPNNQLDALTYEGVCGAARSRGYDLLIMLRDESDWMANRGEVRFLDRRSDGFLFISPGAGEWSAALKALRKHEIPTVVCYRRDVPKGIAWVDPDNEAIVRLGVENLRAKGHKKIAYVGGVISNTRRNFDDVERARIFEEIIFEGKPKKPLVFTGITPDWTLHPDVVPSLLKANVTGIVCLNDIIALMLWDELEKRGLKVPRDFSLVGVDNTSQAEVRGLSSIAFRYQEVGRLAVQAWLELKAGKSAAQASKVVPVEFVNRKSIGAPRQ